MDGTPGGLTTAEITNWTGHVLSARRSDLGELLKRDEAQRTGVYFLLGDDEEAVGDTRCYVGEADVVAERLRYHQREKDFWDRVVVVTSKDSNITKAHGRYLESRLIGLTTDAARVSLENRDRPPTPQLPEADRSDMDYFLAQLQIVLPVLGVNAIRARPSPTAPSLPEIDDSPIFLLMNPKHGVDARAQQIDGEFTVLKGSRIVGSWHGRGTAQSTIRAYQSYGAKHQQLLAEGAIVPDGKHAILVRDIVFGSPSTAGAVCLGRSCNGRREWTTSDGIHFGAWEGRGLDQEPDGGESQSTGVRGVSPR